MPRAALGGPGLVGRPGPGHARRLDVRCRHCRRPAACSCHLPQSDGAPMGAAGCRRRCRAGTGAPALRPRGACGRGKLDGGPRERWHGPGPARDAGRRATTDGDGARYGRGRLGGESGRAGDCRGAGPGHGCPSGGRRSAAASVLPRDYALAARRSHRRRRAPRRGFPRGGQHHDLARRGAGLLAGWAVGKCNGGTARLPGLLHRPGFTRLADGGR